MLRRQVRGSLLRKKKNMGNCEEQEGHQVETGSVLSTGVKKPAPDRFLRPTSTTEDGHFHPTQISSQHSERALSRSSMGAGTINQLL